MNRFFTLLTALVVTAGFANAQSVVVNKIFNDASASSGDVIELLVITNNLDMRGMIIKDYSSSMASDGGGKFTFTTNTLWSSVPSGTLIILRNNATSADITVGSGDFGIDVGMTNTTYFTSGGGTFDISTTEMVQIKSSGSGTAGVTGAIHTLGAGTAGTQFTNSATPKLRSTSTVPGGSYAFAVNTNSVVGDFDGTDASSSASAMTFGSGNNASNTTYISNLRAAAQPISLVKFTADKLSEKVKISWTTATEMNNDKFLVERSVDGESFEAITEARGAGNSKEINNYSIVDAKPLKGTSYYRLTQVDFDGKSETFAPVAVNMGTKNMEIGAVNAKLDAGSIEMKIFSPVSTSTSIRIIDLSGRIIASENISLVEGYQMVNINANALSNGIHLIQLMNGDEVVMKKLVL